MQWPGFPSLGSNGALVEPLRSVWCSVRLDPVVQTAEGTTESQLTRWDHLCTLGLEQTSGKLC